MRPHMRSLLDFHKLVSLCCLGSNDGLDINLRLVLVLFLFACDLKLPASMLILFDLELIPDLSRLWQAALVGFPFIHNVAIFSS